MRDTRDRHDEYNSAKLIPRFYRKRSCLLLIIHIYFRSTRVNLRSFKSILISVNNRCFRGDLALLFISSQKTEIMSSRACSREMHFYARCYQRDKIFHFASD